MLEGVEAELSRWEAQVEMPREFVVPGETRASAALEVARTIIRRAERRTIALERHVEPPTGWTVPYLNRLADLMWVLARAAEQAEHATATKARNR
jgi:cob(I)alamin adenosyltransferase